MSKKRFCYYQPNKKDLKDQYGDCTIRALSKALDVTWLEAYDMMIPLCREHQVSNVFSAPSYIERQIVERLGFTYHGISNRRGSTRFTVDSFAKDHPEGVYILNVANHEVACVDGKYYDTWDCGYKSLYGYYERAQKDKEINTCKRWRVGYKEQNQWRYTEFDDEVIMSETVKGLILQGKDISVKVRTGVKS